MFTSDKYFKTYNITNLFLNRYKFLMILLKFNAKYTKENKAIHYSSKLEKQTCKMFHCLTVIYNY